MGFVDLGARVGFVQPGSQGLGGANATLVAASVAHGLFLGRVVTCVTPPSLNGAAGFVSIELSLNGEARDGAMTMGGEIQFEYLEEEEHAAESEAGPLRRNGGILTPRPPPPEAPPEAPPAEPGSGAGEPGSGSGSP